jgi:hypothetical protein
MALTSPAEASVAAWSVSGLGGTPPISVNNMPGVKLDTQAYRLATVQALDAAFHGQNKSLDKEACASIAQRRS